MFAILRRLTTPANVGAEASAALLRDQRRQDVRAAHRQAMADAVAARERCDTRGRAAAEAKARACMTALLEMERNEKAAALP